MYSNSAVSLASGPQAAFCVATMKKKNQPKKSMSIHIYI